MPSYTCDLCEFSTKNKSDFKRHNSTRKHINLAHLHNNIVENKTIVNGNRDNDVTNIKKSSKKSRQMITKAHICSYCGKSFNHKSGLSRHKNVYCNKNEVNVLKKDNKLKDRALILMKEENLEMREKLIDIKEEKLEIREELIKEKEKNSKQPNNNVQPGNNNAGQGNAAANNNINGNHNNINNNQIVVNNFPEANRNHITDAQYIDAFKEPNNMIPILLSITRCDETIPENYNMWLCNKKTREILVYENGVWIDKGYDSSITEAIYDEMDNVQIVSQRLKDDGTWDEEMLPDQTKTFDKYIETYDLETDVPLVNQPHNQHLLNAVKDKIFCVLKSHRHKKPKQL